MAIFYEIKADTQTNQWQIDHKDRTFNIAFSNNNGKDFVEVYDWHVSEDPKVFDSLVRAMVYVDFRLRVAFGKASASVSDEY